MKEALRNVDHLIRAAVLLGVGVVLFLVLRGFLLPKDFGRLGHYRPGALDDNRARPLIFAGRAACEECHQDVAESRQGSRHERVNCEACHGALAAHAADPSAVMPILPVTGKLCSSCHERKVARPASFPQVDPEEHSGGEPCTSCHRPHHPEVE